MLGRVLRELHIAFGGAKVVLQCPQCSRVVNAPLALSDPPRTARVITLCDECDDGRRLPRYIAYFDNRGRQLAPRAQREDNANE